MKEDAQLICPIGYDDKNDVWPTVQKFICDRLPLKDVTWKSPISSSFVNIEKLPLRFLPSSAKLFHETHHPYRRFLAPYVHVYLLCAESMDAYKAVKSAIKKWVEPHNNFKTGRSPWIIVYVPIGTSTMDVYNKVYSRLSNDFYTDKAGDHSVMLIIPPEPSSKRSASMSGSDRMLHQSLFQQAYASLADLLGKLRDGVVASFQQRSLLYDADIRKLDSLRGTPNFDFWQLFLVKESLALMYQMLQLPDRALSLYEELEALLAFVPKQSLPVSDWPMVIAPSSSSSSSNSSSSSSGGTGAGEQRTPSKSGSQQPSSSRVEGTPVKEKADGNRSSSSGAEGDSVPNSPNPHQQQQTPGGSGIKPRKDLMTDACRTGEEIIVYSINQARMNILWNRFSLFQLQHYIFARQMYFLLVHLRQPTRCAEKALAYVRSSSASLEQQIVTQQHAAYGKTADPVDDAAVGEDKLVQLRRAQADVWALTASLKLIRECRALLQLLVGGDAKFNSVFYPSSNSNASNSSAGGASNAGSLSYSHGSSSGGASSSGGGTPGGVGGHSSAHEAFQDNLAAISSASTHGSSMVYSSLAELSRSQHGIAHPAGHRKASMGGGDLSATAMSMSAASPASAASVNPAAALRDVLFSPQLDIAAELRDSSRVLGELIEFALRRLQALSSSTVRDAGKKALDLALSTVPFSVERFGGGPTQDEGNSSSGVARRTVTKVGPGGAQLLSTSAATATITATSSKNADLVVTIEQELGMLDESRENEGVAEVGDRMDQILLSIAQKVRSTSHFWAKLYELSTPAHLLVAAGITPSSSSVPAGANNVEGDRSNSNDRDAADSFSNPASPISSPFSSRVATPMGSPMPAGPSTTTAAGVASSSNSGGGVAMRKMISRHSSRSLVMSKSQLERGKLLELCLSVLGCSAQWHLHLLANRPRFAVSAMLRCADLLMCNNQLVVAAKRLEEALQCGLLAPAAAYICSKGPGHHTAGPLSSSHANQRSIFQQCLAEEQLHQQQYLQHRAMNLATALQERMEYPLYGLWSPLWHWTLRKLLYCMQQGGQWVEYRIVLANLLVPTSADGVNRVPLQPESLLQDLLREFISLSTVASTSAVDSVNSRAVEAEHAVEAADASSAPPPPVLVPESPKQHQQRFAGLPVLRLPLGNYFGISVGMIRTAAAAKASDVVDAGAGTAGAGAASPSDGTTNDENHDPEPVLVQGFQVVREEWLPVAAMQCEGGRGDGYCLPVTLVSKLPGPVPVDSFVVVYRRFDAEGIVHQVLHAEDKNLHQNSSHEDCFKASADEFVCAPMALQQPTAEGSKAVLMLEPGVHNICMRFHPPTLGDYRLDRILLSVGSAVFESHLLPALSDTSSHLYPHPYMASAQANTGGTSLDAMFGDETTRNGAGVAMSLTRGEDTSMTNGGMDDAAGSGRMFTAGEGRALAVLKEFFKEHSIIQVLPPPDLLQLCASLSSAVPLQQEDDAYFTLRTFSADVIHNLTVTVCGAGGGGVGGYSSAGGDSGSLFLTRGAAGELGSAQNALKLAHGSRAVSGFISEENATPAARRKRVEQHNALDEEEVQAMASATAAVASLLAQQARDRDASSKRGMGTGAVAGNAVVTVADPAHWAAFASDIGACADSGDSRDSSVSLDPVTFERTSDISVDPPSVGIQIPQLPSNKRLHLRVPFTVAAAEGCASGGEAALSIELKGLLVRGPCRIPISLRKKVSVRALQPVTMLLEPFVLEAESGAAGNVATRDVLLQARLRNNTEVALELTSYGLASVAAFAPSPSPSPTTTACFILDGPSELSCLKGDQNHEKEMGESAPLQVVELQPAEEFPAGLIVRFPAEASPPAGDDRKCVLEFSYQRNPTAMLPQVHAGIYKHRTFTARRAVLLLKSGDEADRADSAGLVRVGQEESSVRTVVPAPSPLRLKCALEVQSAGVRAGAGAGAGAGVRSGESCPTASAPIPKAVAVLGKVYSVSYKLAVHIAATSSGNRFVDHAGAVVNVHIVADAGSSPSSASSVVVPALASLAVSLCETEGWMVCGRSRRVLFCSPFTRASAKTDADADAGAPDNTKHAMAFQLQWELVPVRLGVAPLPPVRVEYEWEQSSPAGVSAGVGMRESQLVYPSPLKANDSALVIPAATTATAGGTLEKLAVMLSPSEQTTPYVPVLQRLLSSSEKIVEFHCSLVSV